MLPTPRWTGDRWEVDLRKPWGFGRPRLPVDLPPPPHGLVPAIHAAYATLEARRLERGEVAQLDLPGTGGRTFAQTVAEWLAEKRWAKAGGERWTREVCKSLVRELGSHPLAAFAPPAGTRLVYGWKEELRPKVGPERFGPRTMQDRLIVLGQILTWCSEPPRQWLPVLPTMPPPTRYSGEPLYVPSGKWIDEGTFRATRAELYNHEQARRVLSGELRRAGLPSDAAAVYDVICRRQLFCSFSFYTGMRTADLWLIDDASVTPEFDTYWRFGRKTGVDRAPEAVPPPLLADLEWERRRLGRPWRAGELICGGKWKNACRVIRAAAARAGVEGFNLRDCRRSFVYHKALAGVPKATLKNLLGHSTDSRMVDEVYLTLQPRLQRDMAGAAWPRTLTTVPGTGDARILAFPGGNGVTPGTRSTAKSTPKRAKGA